MSASRDDPFPASSAADAAQQDGEACGDAALRVLAWLVPSQVHKLNNLIMQASGAADLLEAGAVADAVSLRGPLASMAERLAALARFSKGRSGARTLGELARELSLLLDPLADGRVTFELLACAEGRTHADPPLAALVVLAAREIALTARADVPSRERIVRLRIAAPKAPGATGATGAPGGTGATSVTAWISALPALARDEAHERRVLAAVGARVASAGVSVTGRTLGRARSWRLVFPAEVGAAWPPPPRGARILLVDADTEVGDLVSEVLSEQFRVRLARPGQAARAALEGARFELVLVAARSLAADPELLPALRHETSRAERCTIAVLGRTSDPDPGLPHYREPLAPEPLLRFVRTCLASLP